MEFNEIKKNNIPFVVHCGFNNERETNLVKKFASDYGCEYWWEGIKNEIFKSADKIKYASFAVIWNGYQHTSMSVTKICELRGIPKCYIEWGMLPQSDNFFIDPLGFCGQSILCKDLSWVDKKDMEALCLKREYMQKQYPRDDGGYVLVPLQIENDTQVLHNSPYNNMEEFVSHVESMYPNSTIIVKPHPKSPTKRTFNRAHSTDEKDFLKLASNASVVVSISSTTLYESAILGVPVVALGEHPIRLNKKDKLDKVLAGALALNIDRSSGSIKSVLDRFNIKPILR
jgi:hypothetical protein